MQRELHIVGFQVGRETYGVSISALHEIVRVPEITSVPDTPDCIEGVMNLRGRIVAILDLRKRFGAPVGAPSPRHRILVVEHKGKLAGLMVDSASEVLKIPANQVEPPPAAFLEGKVTCVTGLAKCKDRLVVLLDLEKLLQEGAAPARQAAAAVTAH